MKPRSAPPVSAESASEARGPALGSTGSRLTLRVRRVPGAPAVALSAWVRGGARAERIPGQALLAGRMLTEGTLRRDFRAIAAESEALGMSLAGFGAQEAHGVSCDALAGDWQRAAEWVTELLLEPAFPVDRCDWLRRQTAGELSSLRDQPDVVAGWAFLEQLYSPHSLARPIQGDEISLASLGPEACAEFHRAGLERGVILTVAGDVEEAAVRERFRHLADALGEGAAPAVSPPEPAGLPILHREVALPGDQAHLFLGHLTVERAHPDFPALELLSVVLGSGSGLAGRIPTRIREREGLAYTAVATAASGAGLDRGRLVAYLATAPENTARAEAAVVEELQRLRDGGVTAEEVAEARSYLLGREPFRRETPRQWADLLAEAELYGLPVERADWVLGRYAALDRAAVEAALERHLDVDALRVTVGLPA